MRRRVISKSGWSCITRSACRRADSWSRIESLENLVRVNVQGPVTVTRIAGYAASKAFSTILAEGLWAEFSEQNVDVIVACAIAIPTPGYMRNFKQDSPGMSDPSEVADRTLKALGRGPRFISGSINRIFAAIFSRLLPRRAAIHLMGGSTRHLP